MISVRLGLYEQLRPTKYTEELWHVVRNACDSPPAEYFEKLCASVQRRTGFTGTLSEAD